MAFTTPRTWAAAEVVTAANMNTHVRDNIAYMYGGLSSTKLTHFARQNAVTSIANTTYTDVIFQTEDRDIDSAYNNATGVYTFPIAGIWHVSTSLAFASNATGVRGIKLLLSSGLFWQNWVTAATDALGHCSVSAVVQVTAASTCKVQAYQSSGGALNTSGNNDSTFSSSWLSG